MFSQCTPSPSRICAPVVVLSRPSSPQQRRRRDLAIATTTTRRFAADFYRIDVPGGGSFGDVLREIDGIPVDGRIHEVEGVAFRLQRLTFAENREFIAGDLMRIEMDFIPTKAHLKKGTAEPIPMEPEEGVGEETAFLFHEPTDVLVLQRGRKAASTAQFARYFQGIAGAEHPPILELILQKDAYKKLEKMRDVRKLHVKLADVNPAILRETGEMAVESIADVLERGGASDLDLTISVRRGQAPMQSEVKGWGTRIMAALGGREGGVKTVKIAGADYADHSIAVDLIRDKMREQCSVRARERHVSFEAREEALRKAFANRWTDLRNMVG